MAYKQENKNLNVGKFQSSARFRVLFYTILLLSCWLEAFIFACYHNSNHLANSWIL